LRNVEQRQEEFSPHGAKTTLSPNGSCANACGLSGFRGRANSFEHVGPRRLSSQLSNITPTQEIGNRMRSHRIIDSLAVTPILAPRSTARHDATGAPSHWRLWHWPVPFRSLHASFYGLASTTCIWPCWAIKPFTDFPAAFPTSTGQFSPRPQVFGIWGCMRVLLPEIRPWGGFPRMRCSTMLHPSFPTDCAHRSTY
jgi:hypothetical protein